MALRRADIGAQFTSWQIGEVNSIEGRMDRALLDYAGEPVLVEVPFSPNPKVVREIERRFTAAGWKVKFINDSDEGIAFELSEPAQ